MQDLADLRWDDVRVFLAAQRHGSLGAAALRLGLDTSTVSRRVTALEDSLGVRLFERTRDGLLPTRATERVLAAAEAMEAAHGRLVRDASDVETAAEGIVRLSVAPGTADQFIAPMLVRLRQRHPRVTVELDASVQARDLTRHEADIALRSVPARGADLVTLKLGTGRWIPAGSADFVAAHGKLAAWTDCPWIGWDRDLVSFPPARWLVQHVPRAEIVLRTSHFSSQVAAARTSLGALLMPDPFLAPLGLVPLRHGKALAPSIEAAPVDEMWLVCHRVLRDLPRIDAVWTFLAEELRSLMPAR